MQRITLEQIASSTNRLPMTDLDVGVALDFCKLSRSKGRDLTMGHPIFCTDRDHLSGLAREGMVMLNSPRQLESGFLFVKIDAGRSFFGRQKAVYASYVSGALDNEWVVGSVFKLLTLGVTGIGNIYRHAGYR